MDLSFQNRPFEELAFEDKGDDFAEGSVPCESTYPDGHRGFARDLDPSGKARVCPEMELRKRSNKLYDPVRRMWVAATPEERVRQGLIRLMIEEKGFPRSLIAVEKEVKELPHLVGWKGRLPVRRVDLLCFAQGLVPLLLVECKEGEVDEKAIEQVVGYNHFVRALHVAVAGEKGIWLKGRGEGLPSYQELLHGI